MRPRVIDGVTVYVGCTFRSTARKKFFQCTGQDTTNDGKTILLIDGIWWNHDRMALAWELVGDVPLVPFPNHEPISVPVSELTEKEKQLADEIIAKDQAAEDEPEFKAGDEVETVEINEFSGLRGVVAIARDKNGMTTVLINQDQGHGALQLTLPPSKLKLIEKPEAEKEFKEGDEVMHPDGVSAVVAVEPGEDGIVGLDLGNGRYTVMHRDHLRRAPIAEPYCGPPLDNAKPSSYSVETYREKQDRYKQRLAEIAKAMQPIVADPSGVLRFRANKIVVRLLEISSQHGYGLNEIAADKYDVQDREQLAQLIGYSLMGFCELSYVRSDTCIAAASSVSPSVREQASRNFDQAVSQERQSESSETLKQWMDDLDKETTDVADQDSSQSLRRTLEQFIQQEVERHLKAQASTSDNGRESS